MTYSVQVVQWQSAGAFLPITLPEVRTLLKAMQGLVVNDATLPDILGQVELHVVRDGMMVAANQRYMASPGPTNVLSFPSGGDMPGILILSVDTLLREAMLYGQDPAEHCVRLLAHGMGHLLGYDHGDSMDALCARMEELALQAYYAE